MFAFYIKSYFPKDYHKPVNLIGIIEYYGKIIITKFYILAGLEPGSFQRAISVPLISSAKQTSLFFDVVFYLA
jgi:hypothetical protein